MRFPAGLRALNHRDSRLFWAGQLVSLVGTRMQSVGQSWLVLTLTNSPFKLGLIGALQWGPMLCLSFLAGVMSLYAFVFAGVTPIGALFVGAVAETWGISATFAVAGAIGLFSLAGLFLWASRRPGAAE